MKKGIKITKDEADQIIIDWNKPDKPHRRVVCVWKGQWYDLRGLSEPTEVNVFVGSLVGVEITKENSATIEIKL